MTQIIEPVCDFRYLNEIVNGKTNLISEIMDVFLKQIREDLECINNAMKTADYKTIRSYAHTMKSSVFIMGMSVLETVLDEMEVLGEAETGIDKIKQLNVRLNQICHKAIIEVETEKLNYT